MIRLPQTRHANLHFITPTLAIGGDVDTSRPLLAARQMEEISSVGITHLVYCRAEWSDEELFARHLPQVAYFHHGIDDAGQDVPGRWFEQALDWIDAAGPDAVVLTHCHAGINRGPSLGFAALLHAGWDPIEAITALRSARPIANVWYAPDALLWHHERLGTDPSADLWRLAAWRDANPLELFRLSRNVLPNA